MQDYFPLELYSSNGKFNVLYFGSSFLGALQKQNNVVLELTSLLLVKYGITFGDNMSFSRIIYTEFKVFVGT